MSSNHKIQLFVYSYTNQMEFVLNRLNFFNYRRYTWIFTIKGICVEYWKRDNSRKINLFFRLTYTNSIELSECDVHKYYCSCWFFRRRIIYYITRTYCYLQYCYQFITYLILFFLWILIKRFQDKAMVLNASRCIMHNPITMIIFLFKYNNIILSKIHI